MNRPPLPLLLIPVLLLAACASPPPRQQPAPVYRSSGAPAVPATTAPAGSVAAPGEGVEVRPLEQAPVTEARAYEPPVTAAPAPRHGPAVVALLESADSQRRGGDLTAAASTLERALRIEPRNPWLWSRLAAVRLQQGRYAMAEELAAKSNSLAGAERELKRRNWELIARARQARGDAAGAARARRRAGEP